MWAGYIHTNDYRCDSCSLCQYPIQPQIRALLDRAIRGRVICHGANHSGPHSGDINIQTEAVGPRPLHEVLLGVLVLSKDFPPHYTEWVEVSEDTIII